LGHFRMGLVVIIEQNFSFPMRLMAALAKQETSVDRNPETWSSIHGKYLGDGSFLDLSEL